MLFERAPKSVFFLLKLYLVAGSLGFAQVCMAAETAPSGASRGGSNRFASVWRLRGDVVATEARTGKPRKLSEGDTVYVGERISADATGEAVLKTEDAGVLAVRPGAAFVVDRFAAQRKPSDGFTVRLLVGALRIVTGWIGQTNHAAHKIITPTATIGIRGTDHEPYVMTDELAESLPQKAVAGTYDKVNRGGTTLRAAGSEVDIDPGKVGFARAPEAGRTRGLMTLLLPVVLDKVPDFYTPGQFEDEVDRLSLAADATATQPADRRDGARKPAAAGTDKPAAELASIPAGVAADGACTPNEVAKAWLGQFDAAIAQRRVRTLLDLFAPDVEVRAQVRGKDGATSTLTLGRDEFTQSLVTAVQGLSDYRQRRLSIEGRVAQAGVCERISVKSVVIEQGKQKGKPYRFESTEEFTLERRDGAWVATQAKTTQR